MMKGVPGFKGVFAHNQIDSLVPGVGDSYIMNLENSNQPGSHWVAFFFGMKSIYFDSFGVPPDRRSLNFLMKRGKDIEYGDVQIQEDQSEECGYYAMAFIRQMLAGDSLTQFLHEFSPNPDSRNEKLAVKEAR